MKKVAIQGIAGSFHENAAHLCFPSEEIEIIPCETFKDVFKSIKKEPSVIGIIAIENTIAGSLLPNYNLLKESGYKIIGEHKLRIEHCICALPGQKLKDIKEVYSHPIALMQCGDFLEENSQLKAISYEDTASSARMIAEKKLMGVAAICSAFAAQLYGLEMLKNGIETNKRNLTRFLIVADSWQAEEIMKGQSVNKSSVVFTLPHEEGSLAKILCILSFYRINLTKIQSLPIIGREWEYEFYVNLTFDDYHRYCQSLDAIRPLIKDFKILGEYIEAETPKQ